MAESGNLYVVATPIGNLEDISQRALRVLSEVTVIAAEDTRHTAKLLKHYGIKTSCLALHEHNESKVVPSLVEKLKQGNEIALVSDAGTPLISDPGYLLVRGAVEHGVNVVSVPGPCAFVAALSVAGLAADRFVFEGFLPPKQGQRLKRLAALASESRTLIFYESCHRISVCIQDMLHIFGDNRKAVILRELTKMYEEVIRGELSDLEKIVLSDERFQKGEYVVVVGGAKENVDEAWQKAVGTLSLLLEELSVSQASKLAAQITGFPKKRLYQYALEYVDGNSSK